MAYLEPDDDDTTTRHHKDYYSTNDSTQQCVNIEFYLIHNTKNFALLVVFNYYSSYPAKSITYHTR